MYAHFGQNINLIKKPHETIINPTALLQCKYYGYFYTFVGDCLVEYFFFASRLFLDLYFGNSVNSLVPLGNNKKSNYKFHWHLSLLWPHPRFSLCCVQFPLRLYTLFHCYYCYLYENTASVCIWQQKFLSRLCRGFRRRKFLSR